MTTEIAPIIGAIVRHLSTELSGVYGVEPMADDVDRYRLSHPNGVVLVHYSGATFSGANNIPIRQDITVQLYVVGRTLHGPQGVWAMNGMVQEALWGWRPAPSADVVDPAQADAAAQPPRQRVGRMYPVRVELVTHSPSQWQYVLTYTFTAPIHAEHAAPRSTEA